MRIGHLMLVLSCLAGISCKSGEPERSSAKQAVSKEPSQPTKKAVPVDEKPAPAKVEEKKLEPATPPPGPMSNQPSHKMSRIEFLGWTADGQLYALLTSHGRDLGEYGGRTLMKLRQVHDALTGKLVDCYRVKKQNPPNKTLARLWHEAKPKERWQDFLKSHPLVRKAGSVQSPGGTWRIEGKRVGKPPLASRFTVKASAGGFSYRWDGLKTESMGKVEESASPKADVLLASLGAGGSKARRLLGFQIPYSYDGIAGDHWAGNEVPHLEGRVAAHWSPAGGRVVLLVSSEMVGKRKFDGQINGRHYVRSAGPQLQLVAPPGEEANLGARRLARVLASKGLPVTRLIFDKKEREKTAIYYRGEAGAASRLAKLIPGQSQVEELKKPGWLDLVVLLGNTATGAGSSGPTATSSGSGGATASLMQGESIGELKIGMPSARAIKLLGEPSSRGKPELWGADGLYHQRWSYSGRGVVLSLVSDKPKGKASVESVAVQAPCKLATKRGVRIGTPEAAARKAYAKDEEKDGTKRKDSFVAGSIYGGMIFSFKAGRVSEIFLGQAAE